MSRSTRLARIAGIRLAFALTLVLAAAAALAQEPTTEGAAPSDTAAQPAGAPEEIVITGSRIRRDPLSQNQPIVDLNAEDIARTGLTSVADVLQRLPNSGGALNSRFNNSGNFGNPPDGGGVGAGAAEADLRYLGSRRVLILVDGLRWVNGSSASGVPAATDLNTIPASMIERIEVLQEGASPIYGSDAISGVINIITKKDYDGFAISAQGGVFRQGDGEQQDYSLTWGTGTETTRVVTGFNYVKQSGVSSSDRNVSAFPTPGVTACDANCSSGTPLGRFIVNPGMGTLDLTLKSAVGGTPAFDINDPTGPTSDFKTFETADRFNFQPFNFIVAPNERIGGFVNVTQELTESVNARVKAVYSTRKSANQAAPIPLFIGPDAGNGNLLDLISVDVTNPFNPFGVTLEPGTYNFIGRRFIEAGPRRFDQTVHTWYVAGTFDGSFTLAGRELFWDVNGIYSRNEANQIMHGNVNALNLAQGLGPVADCVGSPTGCVPVNFFGGVGSITQDQVDFITFVQHDSSKQRLGDLTINLSGEIIELPAGALSFAVGFEHRDHKGSFQPDAIVASGFGSDIPAQPTSGQFNVDELYLELGVPLLNDLPFVHSLEANFATRWSDYSTFGDETTIKVGGLWRPLEDLSLRGSWSEGFRAPGIGELFGTPSRFDQEVEDPCSDMLGLGGGPVASANVQANCIANGVPADGSYVQLNQQLPVITGGNSALDPETSKGWVLGLAYSPAWAEGASWSDGVDFEINYYDIDVKRAIQPISAATLLGRCAETNDALSCGSISRTASGAVAQISGLLQNIASIETKGLDVTLGWRSPDTGFGTFGIQWVNVILTDFTESVPATVGVTNIRREGTERGSPDQAYPEWKFHLIGDWTRGAWSGSWTMRYIKGVDEANDPNQLDGRVYNDIQATWRPEFWKGTAGITLGINNIFGTNAPGCVTCGLNNFDPTTYDAPGQVFYARLTYEM
ncbi:MAG TPA: TonB-dependent receptor [Myxococcota bacterium]|nr:TonB-dependent receptor [Myxococcota bacterium]